MRLAAGPHAVDSHLHLRATDLAEITSSILAVFEDGYKRQSPVSTEHCVGFSELYKVIRNPEASGLSSLLSGISGVHLRTLLGQP